MGAALGGFIIAMIGMFKAEWTPVLAPVYAVLAELVAPQRRATALAIFNLGLTMIGGGLGPLLVGFLSDALVPLWGNEALRYALAITTGSCYLLGMLYFARAMKPYHQECLT